MTLIFLDDVVGIDLGELSASVADCFVSQTDAPTEHYLPDISVAEIKRVIQPDAVGDNLSGKTMTLVTYAHPFSLFQAEPQS